MLWAYYIRIWAYYNMPQRYHNRFQLNTTGFGLLDGLQACHYRLGLTITGFGPSTTGLRTSITGARLL